jgi:hypothetical protein
MDIEKEIKEIKAALLRIEQRLGATTGTKRKEGLAPSAPQSADLDDFSGAIGGIRLLVSKGFFKQRRSMGEVIQALSDEGYLYSKQAFQIAVTRLSKTGGPLTAVKQGKKKTYADRK